MISRIPEAWLADLNNQPAWIDNPDSYADALSARAMDMHRRRQIGADTLADILEMVEAGRWYMLVEREEASAIGLFGYYPEVCEWGAPVRLGDS